MVVLTDLPPPDAGVRYVQSNTHAFIEGVDYGVGTLYIAESQLSWAGADGKGFSLQYPAISLHAISRDHSVFPRDCIYLMVEGELNGNRRRLEKECDDVADQMAGASVAHSGGGDVDPGSVGVNGATTNGHEAGAAEEVTSDSDEPVPMDGDGSISEIRFVPQDSSAYNDGAVEYTAGMGGEFFSAESMGDMGQLTAEGAANLERFNRMLANPQDTGDADAPNNGDTGMDCGDNNDPNSTS